MMTRKHTTETRQMKMNNEDKMSIEFRQNEIAKRAVMKLKNKSFKSKC